MSHRKRVKKAPPVGNSGLERTGWIHSFAAAAILVAAALAVYANSFSAPFVFDGDTEVVKNPAIRQIWPRSLNEAVTRPVGFLTFKLNYALNEQVGRDGYDVADYHALNLAIHVAAGLVLFGIIRRTLLRGQLAGRYSGAAWALALAAALLWLVHPLNTQAVTYIYQRLEALMSLLYLLALYAFIRAQQSRRAVSWYAASVLCGVLAAATKEVAVTLPLAVLWYDRVFVAASWREIYRRRWPYYAALTSTWLVLAALMLLRIEDYPTGGVFVVEGISPLSYALSQTGIILHYLSLAFWPRGLCLDYGWPAARINLQVAAQMSAIAALLAAMLWSIVRRPKLGFLAGSFFLLLGPTSSIAPINDLALEHRMYLPLAAIAMLSVLAAYELASTLPAQVGRLHMPSVRTCRLASICVLSLVAGALGYITILRNQDYRSDLSIWNDTVQKRPDNPRAYVNRGLAYDNLKDYERAMADYDRAIATKPEYLRAYSNRGDLLRRLGRYQDAIRDQTVAIGLRPNAPRYYTRAFLYGKCRQYELAIADYSRGLAQDKTWEAYAALNNRGNAYRESKQHEKAIADYSAIVDDLPKIPGLAEQMPALFNAYYFRGLCYVSQRRIELAIDDFTQALQQAPKKAESYFERSRCRAAIGNYSAAIADITASIALQPNVRERYAVRAQYEYVEMRYREALADLNTLQSLGGQPDRKLVASLNSALQERH